MRTINLTNDKKRDAQVCMESATRASTLRRVLPTGEDYISVKVLKQNLGVAFETLARAYADPKELGEAIIASDVEVDMEVIGKRISGVSRLYLNGEDQIAYRVNMVQVLFDPTGQEKERRDLTKAMSNVTGESIVQWSGRKFPKSSTVRKFVFARKIQIKHISGLTFDFLYAMAKDLADTDSLMFVGGGAKGNEPLILTQGGEPYRGFLEGRVDGETYCLILHLTNLEVKVVTS